MRILYTINNASRKENFSIAESNPFTSQETQSFPIAISLRAPIMSGYNSTNTSRESCLSTHLVVQGGLLISPIWQFTFSHFLQFVLPLAMLKKLKNFTNSSHHVMDKHYRTWTGNRQVQYMVASSEYMLPKDTSVTLYCLHLSLYQPWIPSIIPLPM